MIEIFNQDAVWYFATKVFNYYNGRINTCNIARAEMNWLNMAGKNEAGISRNPNLVILYPSVIARYTDDYFQFCFVLMETIIHELFHQDQMIDYIKMTSDPNYVRLIESAVEIETNLYIANHVNEILYEFGFDISRYNLNVYRDNVNMFECGFYYKRRTWFDHILIVLREMIYYYDTFMDVRNDLIALLTGKSNIDKFRLVIDGNEILIYDRGSWINISALNNFSYENFFKYTSRVISVTYGRDNFLEIRTDLKNIMCKFGGNYDSIK